MVDAYNMIIDYTIILFDPFSTVVDWMGNFCCCCCCSMLLVIGEFLNRIMLAGAECDPRDVVNGYEKKNRNNSMKSSASTNAQHTSTQLIQ